MEAKSMFAAVFVLLVVVASPPRASAVTHNVGDSLGWTIPSNSSIYSDWASTKTFRVGDILFFNFTSGQHDVTEVTKSAFDSCSGSNPISAMRNGPASIPLTAAGTRNFICSFPTHCSFGQKLSVTVRAQSSSPPTGSPAPAPKSRTPISPSPHSGHPPKASPAPETATPPSSNMAPSTPPPPPNSANSLGGFGLFVSVGLAIVVAMIN